MNVRWLMFDYADPALPMTFRQRLRAAFRTLPLITLPPGFLLARVKFTGAIAPMLFVPHLGLFLLLPMQPAVLRLYAVLVFLWVPVFWIWSCFAYGLICRREHFHRIRLEGFDVCMGCGYWLRGLDEEVKRCPECGAAREAMPPPQAPERSS